MGRGREGGEEWEGMDERRRRWMRGEEKKRDERVRARGVRARVGSVLRVGNILFFKIYISHFDREHTMAYGEAVLNLDKLSLTFRIDSCQFNQILALSRRNGKIICRVRLPRPLAESVCRGRLPRPLAKAACHGLLPRPLAEAAFH